MNRPLRAASGLAVFLMVSFLGVMVGSTFIFQRRLFSSLSLAVLGSTCSVVAALSLVAVYLLISDAIKSK